MPGFEELSDAQLLRAARRDAEAFRVLFRRHAASVYAALRRELDDPGAAEDITAETFARAWLARAKFRDERDGSALPWLRGIASNLARNHRRGERTRLLALERLGINLAWTIQRSSDPAIERIDEIDVAMRRGDELAAGLTALPVAQREAVQLRVIDGCSYREIADRQNTNPTHARVRVARGIAKLRKALEREASQ